MPFTTARSKMTLLLAYWVLVDSHPLYLLALHYSRVSYTAKCETSIAGGVIGPIVGWLGLAVIVISLGWEWRTHS